jgi:hypothetical protein
MPGVATASVAKGDGLGETVAPAVGLVWATGVSGAVPQALRITTAATAGLHLISPR